MKDFEFNLNVNGSAVDFGYVIDKLSGIVDFDNLRSELAFEERKFIFDNIAIFSLNFPDVTKQSFLTNLFSQEEIVLIINNGEELTEIQQYILQMNINSEFVLNNQAIKFF